MNTQIPQSQDTMPSAADASVRRVAHDLPGLRHETKDVLKQLQANIDLLEDLGGRLGFVLTEVRSLIRR